MAIAYAELQQLVAPHQYVCCDTRCWRLWCLVDLDGAVNLVDEDQRRYEADGSRHQEENPARLYAARIVRRSAAAADGGAAMSGTRKQDTHHAIMAM